MWSTYRRRAALGHNRVYPDVLCLILLPLTPFFWVVKISVVKLAAWRSLAMSVAATEVSIFRAEWVALQLGPCVFSRV